MENYFDVVRISLLLFPLIAFFILLPYVVINYRKYGYVQLNRALVFYLFLFYMCTAFFMTLLPLPELTENFCAIRAGKLDPNFTPFRFLTDLNHQLKGNITLNGILKSSTFMVTIFNVLLLMPLGFFLRYLFGLRSVLLATVIGFLVSLFFEVTQLTGIYGLYPCAFRLFEVDDLITNTTGALLGFLIAGHMHFLPDISKKSLPTKATVTFTQRFLALFIDLSILAGITGAANNLVTNNEIYFDVLKISLYAFYFIGLTSYLNGQTIGKKILGLKIVSNSHQKPSVLQLFKRYFVLVLTPLIVGLFSNFEIEHTYYNAVYALIYFGFLTIWIIGVWLLPLLRKTQIGWHDKWANTHQVKTVKTQKIEH